MHEPIEQGHLVTLDACQRHTSSWALAEPVLPKLVFGVCGSAEEHQLALACGIVPQCY